MSFFSSLRFAARVIFALFIFCTVTCTLAFARDRSVVPGDFVPNALPSVPLEDPVVGKDVLVEILGTTQFKDFSGTDTAYAPYFRVVVPFRQLAAIEVDGLPVEFWNTSPDVQAARGARHSNGTAPGDVRFGAKFYIIRETESVPAFAVRFLTKSTTGKSFDDKRFTDAPGYMLDLLAAKTILEQPGFVRRLRVMAQIGFAAWQQGIDGQDDALTLGAAVQATLQNSLMIEAQVRGYMGWMDRDNPAVAGVTASYPFKFFRALVTLNRGLTRDAPAWEARAGVEFFFEIPYLKRARQ